ncbi:hypothetical protein Pla22_41450 [Rubripirellula amarantea]|uniref:DUF3445 domain-containing protein n=1 Tax=Rubripirellula amarantea TaxID=2527999 RepID=A0A5C5WKV5_9BACT|nr:DUF3445 domain-containing protein [Rubripirellula amarantea]TWT51368.1 hypothetical protein Pla22_41450 [Rubripirellula amarantea]
MIFPLKKPVFEHQFGIRAIADDEPLLAHDEFFEDHVILKRLLINDDPQNYVALTPGCLESVVETTRWIRNQSDSLLDRADEPITDFVTAAIGVQEDIVICQGEDDFAVMAGVVCFPSGWSIAEKIGLPLSEVHGPVPGFASAMAESTRTLMDRLKVGRPVSRTNWGVRASARWDQSPKHSASFAREAEKITCDNAGHRCHFRVERQTLSRLERTGDIVFTIHTMQCPVVDLTAEQQRILLGVLTTCPAETLTYKGISVFGDRLCGWLRAEPGKSA